MEGMAFSVHSAVGLAPGGSFELLPGALQKPAPRSGAKLSTCTKLKRFQFSGQ